VHSSSFFESLGLGLASQGLGLGLGCQGLGFGLGDKGLDNIIATMAAHTLSRMNMYRISTGLGVLQSINVKDYSSVKMKKK